MGLWSAEHGETVRQTSVCRLMGTKSAWNAEPLAEDVLEKSPTKWKFVGHDYASLHHSSCRHHHSHAVHYCVDHLGTHPSRSGKFLYRGEETASSDRAKSAREVWTE